ncbi:ABC transporter ATP-binding protein [Sphingobium sp. AN641]|uniref:ABC transporter ATP-binding protein n=1 Tax=Sphingobium sp. AN641 TaxID=3133443 RepID=UPI0030C38499
MIRFENVSKVYETQGHHNLVLFDLNFTIARHARLGICGANGAGKSTLMRLLSGAEAPTTGRVIRTMSTSWPLGYSSAFQSSLSGADNARFIARIYGKDVQSVLDFVEDYAQLGSYFRQPLNTYSAGMSGRLAFGISLAIDFECYLIDEATAAGDERFQRRTQEALTKRHAKAALVMVSHVPESLRSYCSSGAVLYGGQITFYDTIDEAIEVHNYNQRKLKSDRAVGA